MELQKIPLGKIKLSKDPIRDPKSGDIDELGKSIKALGNIVPVMVVPNGTGYEAVFGNRRVSAARKAGTKEILALVADGKMSRLERLEAAIAENMAREDMSALDKGKALKEYKRVTGYSDAVIGRKLGKKESSVRRFISLAKEPQSIQQLIETRRTGGVSADVVEKSRAASGTDRVALLNQAAKVGLTAADVEQRAKLLAKTRIPVVKKQIITAKRDADYLSGRWADAASKKTVTVGGKRVSARKITFGREAKSVLTAVINTTKDSRAWIKAIKAGHFSPEGLRFLEGKIRVLEGALGTVKAAISNQIKKGA
jgi:ParB family chromosome partitioning protein